MARFGFAKRGSMKAKTKIFLTLAIILGIISFYIIGTLGFWLFARDRIYPGVSVAGISLSLKTKVEAQKVLDEKTQSYLSQKINFSGKEIAPGDVELRFDTEKSIQNAISVGNKNPFFLGKKANLPLEGSFSSEKSYNITKKFEKENQKTVVNSQVKKTETGAETIEGKDGQQINYAQTAANFAESFKYLKNQVVLATFKVAPTFTARDLGNKEELVKEKITGPITLTAEGKKFEVAVEKIYSWVQVPAANETLAFRFGKEDFLAPLFSGSNASLFSESRIKEYLTEIAPKVNQNAVNAQLALADGRATVFIPSQKGKTLNLEKSAFEIASKLENSKKEVALSIDIKNPEITEETINNMGIVELVSTGYSNFTGSPTNRKHNIRTGASKFNGVLIKPDETFSFIKTLGPVDASTGYLPELVIKENKTIPEYGGGMCQVSSTAFRAALNAGLPILERNAHSYPVSYYKPFGVDATVYIPKPDLVFKNDTGKYILIQTKIEGTKLTFDFYGTKVNRTVKFAGNENATDAVFPVEKVSPLIYDQGVRGNNSFTAVFWRFIYDETGKLINTKKFVSKYDTPDNYPH